MPFRGQEATKMCEALRRCGVGEREPRGSKRREETRRRLTAAAYEVFTEHSIRDATVEQICDRAGFTRGAFYSNFATKEDLFLAMFPEQVQERLDRLQAAVGKVVERSVIRDEADVRKALAEIGTLFLQPLVADRDWYLLTSEFRVQALRHPELRDRAERVQRYFYDRLGDFLAEMLDRLGLKLALDPHDAAIVIVSLYETALERALYENTLSPIEDRVLTDVLPRLLAALIVPGTSLPAAAPISPATAAAGSRADRMPRPIQ